MIQGERGLVQEIIVVDGTELRGLLPLKLSLGRLLSVFLHLLKQFEELSYPKLFLNSSNYNRVGIIKVLLDVSIYYVECQVTVLLLNILTGTALNKIQLQVLLLG